MLPSLSHIQQDRHRLEGLADAAVCLQEPGIYSPAESPSSPDFQEYTFGMHNPTSVSCVLVFLYLPSSRESILGFK